MVKLAYLGKPTHKECINFRDGICTLYGIPVDPNQPACPNFTPKTAYQQPWFRRFGFGRGISPYQYGYPYMPVFPWMPWLYPPTKEEELRILEDHAKILEQQLNDIKRRLKELERS